MNRSLIFFIVLLAMLATAVPAEEIPVIRLDEGSNEIVISVVNSLNRDITGLTIEAEGHEMPAWLTVGSTLRSIGVGQGEKGPGAACAHHDGRQCAGKCRNAGSFHAEG